MSGIPETERQHQDFVDLMLESFKTPKQVQDQTTGESKEEMIINSKIARYKLQLVNSNTYGRFVLVLENYLNLAHDAYNHMTRERANVIANQILRKYEAYQYSIDAKSSETVQDKHNNRGSLIHIMNNKTIEKKFTMKDEMKKGLAAGWFGGTKETE